MSATLLARRIAVLIERTRVDVSTEAAAHREIAAAIEADGMDVEREVRLGAGERVDVLVGGVIAVEVKVQGSRRDIHRQLERYARSDRVEGIVLATGAAWPATMRRVGGKPFFFASLSRGWL